MKPKLLPLSILRSLTLLLPVLLFLAFLAFVVVPEQQESALGGAGTAESIGK